MYRISVQDDSQSRDSFKFQLASGSARYYFERNGVNLWTIINDFVQVLL